MSGCGDCGFTIETRSTLPDAYRAELEDAATCNRLIYWRHVLRLESLEQLAPDRWHRILTTLARRWRRAFDAAQLEGAELPVACEIARRALDDPAVSELGERWPAEWRELVTELGNVLHAFAPAWWRDRPLERTLMVGTGITLTLPPHDLLGRPIAQRFRLLPLTLDRLAVLRELGTVVDTVAVEVHAESGRQWRHDGYMKALTLAAKLLARTMGLMDEGPRAVHAQEIAGVRVTTFAHVGEKTLAFTSEETVAYSDDELDDWFADTCMERAEWSARRMTAEQHAWPRVAVAQGPCGWCEFRELCEHPTRPAVRALFRQRGDQHP